MLALLELTTPQLAAKDGSALPIYPVREVRTGDADLLALAILELPIVQVVPVIHR